MSLKISEILRDYSIKNGIKAQTPDGEHSFILSSPASLASSILQFKEEVYEEVEAYKNHFDQAEGFIETLPLQLICCLPGNRDVIFNLSLLLSNCLYSNREERKKGWSDGSRKDAIRRSIEVISKFMGKFTYMFSSGQKFDEFFLAFDPLFCSFCDRDDFDFLCDFYIPVFEELFINDEEESTEIKMTKNEFFQTFSFVKVLSFLNSSFPFDEEITIKVSSSGSEFSFIKVEGAIQDYISSKKIFARKFQESIMRQNHAE